MKLARLFYDRGRAENDHADGDDDGDIDEHKSVIAHRIDPHVIECAVFGKSEYAREHMRCKTQHARYDGAERKLHLRYFFEFLHSCEHARYADCGKGDGVIQKELRGVNEPRILHRLQYAVHKSRINALAHAEHVRIEHERKKRRKRDRTALRHGPQLDIREGEAHRNAHGGVGNGFGIEFLLLAPAAENCDESDDKRNADERQTERNVFGLGDLGAVVVFGVARSEIDDQADEEGDKRRADERRRSNRHRAEGLFRAKRSRVDRTDSQQRDDGEHEGGVKHDVEHGAVLRHLEKFKREHGDDDGDAKSDEKGDRHGEVLFEPIALFEPHEKSDCDQHDEQRDGEPQKNLRKRRFGKRRPDVGIVVMLYAVFVFVIVVVSDQQGREKHNTPLKENYFSTRPRIA